MIELRRGDILRAEAEALVNTVNCVGVMGRGIALQFKKAFPEMFREYKRACDAQTVVPGVVLVHEVGRLHGPRFVISVPTKRHWRGKSRLEDVKLGLDALVREVQSRGIRSIAVPPLGCGLGGLAWDEVRPLIEEAFSTLPEVELMVYEPAGPPAAEKMVKADEVPKMTVGRAALLGLMRRYLSAAMDPDVTLLEVHKLLYFLQEAGEGLRLRYAKGTYGPYAENLRHVLSLVEGHFISGYGDASDQPDRVIELKPHASDQAEAYLREHEVTLSRFERVASLIEGFETPYGMELLSTVHWVASQEGAGTADDAVRLTYSWNQRKNMFQEEHIRAAWKVLRSKGWLGPRDGRAA